MGWCRRVTFHCESCSIGLDMNYNNGQIVPFYEMYPQQSSIQPIYTLTAYTGDTLLCMVCKDPNNSAETEFEIIDWTNYNWIFFEYLFVPTPYSAEWIIETPNNPQEYEGTYPIVNFSDCTWTDGNGNPQNINSSEDTTLCGRQPKNRQTVYHLSTNNL
jgi:Peptidase A4 family